MIKKLIKKKNTDALIFYKVKYKSRNENHMYQKTHRCKKVFYYDVFSFNLTSIKYLTRL